VLGHPSGVAERPAQQHLDLRVEAAQLVVGPADQRVVNRRVDPEQDLSALPHEYSDPALTTGDGGCSPHSTTIRLLTMLAVRSSSSATTPS
jgi:hypothetical protein